MPLFSSIVYEDYSYLVDDTIIGNYVFITIVVGIGPFENFYIVESRHSVAFV